MGTYRSGVGEPPATPAKAFLLLYSQSLDIDAVAVTGAAEIDRSSEMIKRTVVFTCMIALALPVALSGCCRVEVANLTEELEATRIERDELAARLAIAEQARGQSQQDAGELSGSLAELQQQVDAFLLFREELQKREDELKRLRQAAAAEAQTAQQRMDKLSSQLDTETQRVRDLQDQLKQAQTSVSELQEKLTPEN